MEIHWDKPCSWGYDAGTFTEKLRSWEQEAGTVWRGCVAGDVRWEQLYNWDMSWDRHGEAM